MATVLSQPELVDRALSRGLGIAPITPTIGAELSGIDLDRPLSNTDAELIRAAWLRYKVIFFRDADISYESHPSRSPVR
jgi:taurine dioxygenase